ncbi:hypothetical protein [Hydrogenophaga sp. RWCD_12]|uniref:hypothetical protein n=1 Tax=Hydrogenophaga sp. RWCD_12 TaxID=3391190 RepID=UPI0039850AB0
MRTSAIASCWPATQSLDLVQAPIEAAANAVEKELRRFLGAEQIEGLWLTASSIDQAIKSCEEFTNVPTCFFVLPTKSRWSVLWNNSWLCDGYDSLCHGLTTNHGLTTLHWSAHDQDTTFQSGAAFSYRACVNGAVTERSVYCGRQDTGWTFYEGGVPLPEEDIQVYEARRKRDRLNERVLLSLIERLGAQPWNEAFYDLPSQKCYVLRRASYPSTITRRRPSEVFVAA